MDRRDDGPQAPEGSPTAREIAGAYLRIAHIYRMGGITNLAAEYYGLVVTRFSSCVDLAGRARIWRARCLAAAGSPRAARRHLRAVVRDPASATPLRCHAALRLLDLATRTYEPARVRETRRLIVRRLRAQINAPRLARWVRIADQLEHGETTTRGMVAES